MRRIDTRKWRSDLERSIATRALPRVKAQCQSNQLRRWLQVHPPKPEGTPISVPHHWAVFYHDGRTRPILPVRGSVLVWFTDPRDDPRRHTFDYTGQRLTRQQFYEGLAENRRRRAAAGNSASYEPFMVVTRAVRKPTAPHPFFEQGLSGTWPRVKAQVVRETHRLARSFFPAFRREVIAW